MLRAVQCRILLAFALVLPATALRAAGEPMTIVPVIDRPGEDVYCAAAAEVLAGARTSIDLILSNGELAENPLWDEIILAHERGVRVRVLLDQSDWAASITEKNRPTIDALRAHGIDARFDDPATTIHAKLLVVDRETSLVGSSNWNRWAFLEQEQSNMLIRDSRVGEAFASVFDRVWRGELEPGGLSLPEEAYEAAPAVAAILDVDGTAMYAALALDALTRAEASVHMVMYRLSVYPGYSDSLANRLVGALAAAAGRGLDVRVVIDDCSFYPDSAQANLTAALYLAERGIDVRFDDPLTTTHAKLLVIDGRDVLLGSTNWNYYSVERNIEANVAVRGMPQVAAAYEVFFERIWAGARDIGRR